MMNGRFGLCKCCHAQRGSLHNFNLCGLTVRGREKTVQEHLVHKVFEDIDGLKRSVWLLSPRSRTNELITDPEPRLTDFMPIMEMRGDKHAFNDKMDVKTKGDEIIQPDPHEIEAGVYSSMDKGCEGHCPIDHSLNNCLKCPIKVLQCDNHVAKLSNNSVPGSSDNHQSTWRQPAVGRRIIANFNQVTSVRSTNNLRDQVDQQVISGSGKIHSHTNNKCGSTMEGRAVLSHSNNSAFVSPQIAEDLDSSMDKLSDVNHNNSEQCLNTDEEIRNNNTPSINGEFTDPEIEFCCDCDSCMLEEEISPAPKHPMQKVKFCVFLVLSD